LFPYTTLFRSSMMLAQLELRQDLPFITEGLSFRTMANTTRNAFFDVTRQYRPFYYQYTGLNPNTGNPSYYLINENAGTEYLDYSEGGKLVSSVFYMESALNYSRTFHDKHAFSGLLVHILRYTIQANAGDLLQLLPYRNNGLPSQLQYAHYSP